MWLGCFGRNHDIGTIARRTQGNSQANSATSTSYK
jgi:hypothetical protein